MKTKKETFPEYLRRVGADYAESGAEFTAEDYSRAADRIEELESTIARVKASIKGAR